MNAQDSFEALLALCLHLCVIVLQQLAVGVDQVDEAGVRVPNRRALS